MIEQRQLREIELRVLVLRKEEGKTFAEIATAIGRTLVATKSLYYKARRKLMWHPHYKVERWSRPALAAKLHENRW